MEQQNNPLIAGGDKTFVLIAVPTWYGAGKMGTETAPEAFKSFCLDEKFRAKGIKNIGWFDVVPEGIKQGRGSVKARYEEEIFYMQRKLYLQARGFLMLRKIPIVFGGSHEISIGSIAGQAIHAGGAPKIGIIWIDAHMDAHTPDTSPSGNIHGMPLAVLLGHGSVRLKDVGGQFQTKAYPHNIVHIGANSWEPAEMEFFIKNRIPFFPQKEICTDEGFARMCAAITALSTRVEKIVVSIDTDAFDKSIAPGVHLQNENGISEERAYALARHIRTCPNIGGIDVAEVVPGKDPAGKTIEFMYKFLVELLVP